MDYVIKIIPNCSGEKDLHQIINACDLAVNSIEKCYDPILIKYINTKQTGRALKRTKYRDISSLEKTKAISKDIFEFKQS